MNCHGTPRARPFRESPYRLDARAIAPTRDEADELRHASLTEGNSRGCRYRASLAARPRSAPFYKQALAVRNIARGRRRRRRRSCPVARDPTPPPVGRSGPADVRVATVDEQADVSPDRQRHLGRDVAERQAGDDRGSGDGANARDRRRERVAAVERRRLKAAHSTDDDRLLRIEHARLVQLQQVALDAIRMLVDVFEEEDAAADARPMRRRQQRVDDREVAAPERAADGEAVEAL